MDTLINQISDYFENTTGAKKNQAAAYALEEVLLSGLSRSGFMKMCLYMPEFNHRLKNNFALYFYHPEGAADFQNGICLSFLNNELDAAGIKHSLKETRFGFKVEINDRGEIYQIKIYIIRLNALIDQKIAYHQIPLSYEIRYGDIQDEKIRSDIQNAVTEIKKSEKNSAKMKKEAEKTPKTNRRKKESENQPLQPSLFDF